MTLNLTNIKTEIVNFLRNSDIFSVGTRGVTTRTDTGTFDSDSTYTLANAPTTVKNVRSVTRGSLLVYGEDYTVNFSTGVISFTSAQTGAYTIIYDNGSDKIYPDFPRDDLTISSYPRMAIDIQSVDTDALGIGGDTFISNINFTVVVYANTVGGIDGYIQAIKDAMRGNAKLFYYVNFVKPTITGPVINSPDMRNEIMQRNTDFQGMFQEE